jgi:hypothetical protein
VLCVDVDNDRTTAASVIGTEVDSAYGVRLDGHIEPAIRSDALDPLPDMAYAKAVDESMRRQRAAVYRYVLQRLWRFPPKTLLQLLTRTVRNKIVGLIGDTTR